MGKGILEKIVNFYLVIIAWYLYGLFIITLPFLFIVGWATTDRGSDTWDSYNLFYLVLNNLIYLIIFIQVLLCILVILRKILVVRDSVRNLFCILHCIFYLLFSYFLFLSEYFLTSVSLFLLSMIFLLFYNSRK